MSSRFHRHHDLKCETEFFQAIESGKKRFEVRINDRDFQVNDDIVLWEVVGGAKTGRASDVFRITYILNGGQFGISDDYVVMQLGGFAG